jgi:glycosyltransferase involved in cell wall biosynthesis
VGLESVKELLRPYYLKGVYFKLFPQKRHNLADCWNNPHFSLETPLEILVAPSPGHPDILFLPMTDWRSRIQRTHHLAMNFGALGSRCFYLNPHLGRQFPRPYSRRDRFRLSLVAPQVLELHVHLRREPIYHHRLLTSSETGQIVDGVRRLTAACGGSKMIQFVSFPLWSETALRLKRDFGLPIVYDCHDLLSGFRSISQGIVAAEASLLEGSNLVCFSSQWLLDETLRRHPAIREKSMIVRNAVAPSDFAGVPPPPPGGRPTIGYVGSLDFWFDIEAVRLAATRHPEWNFVLIGRIESEPVGELASLPNVVLVGEVPYAKLPARMAEFDAAIIPFLEIPLTLATNPLKIYEYFSLGLPVAATRLPEIQLFERLVYLCDGPGDFVRQLERAVAERDPSLRAERQAIAAQNSWRARCEELSQRFAAL